MTRARRRNDHWAFAALPLLFAVHQFTETFVWWALEGTVPHGLGMVAKWGYLLFAFVVLPSFVPLAILTLEPRGTRRRVMMGFVALGAAVSTTLLVAMLRGPVRASLAGHHIAYSIHLPLKLVVIAAYVVATCASALVSVAHAVA